MSISGGLFRCMEHGQTAGCEVVQLFSKSERQWLAKPITDDDIGKFTEARARTGVVPVMIHDSYLINLSSPDDTLWGKSIDGLRDELLRARQLGVPYVNMHPGSHVGSGVEVGLDRMVTALDRLGAEGAYKGVTVLLETTAGQGTNLGSRFEEIGYLIAHTQYPDAFGVCLDTCHIFVAGYDYRTAEQARTVLDEFDKYVGMDKLVCIHANDTDKACGSKSDRHAHIGDGEIGYAGFAAFFEQLKVYPNLPATVAVVVETPDSETMVAENVYRIKRLGTA